MGVTIINADILKWCEEYAGEPFHALFADAPYNLDTIGDRFGKDGSMPAQYGKDGAFQRASRGFMNQEWDNEIAMNPDTWKAVAKHLYPGAFLLVFVGCLNDDLISLAMRQAGLEKFHSWYWIFGSGFPKATNISKGLDKRAGEEGEIIGKAKGMGKQNDLTLNGIKQGRSKNFLLPEYDVRLPATEMAKTWSGHRYGRQAIKPATEVILVFRKPYVGKPIDCITKTGAGALNIEAGRIGSETVRTEPGNLFPGVYGEYANCPASEREGRWPSNLLLDENVAPLLDQQSGHLTSGKPAGVKKATNNIYGQYGTGLPIKGIGDSGGASRFFFNSNWNAEVEERIEETLPFIYKPKAGVSEREKGLEKLKGKKSGYRPNDPDENSLQTRADGSVERKNSHPTVKNLSLCKYLASLLLPPKEYAPRRVLVPFAGVASECVGAMLAGFEEVVGAELSEEYCEIGRKRVAFWEGRSGLFEELQESEKLPLPQQTTLDWDE